MISGSLIYVNHIRRVGHDVEQESFLLIEDVPVFTEDQVRDEFNVLK